MFENLKDILWAANPRNRIWPRGGADLSKKGPKPRVLSFAAALEMRRREREERHDLGR